jgi:hypothetical protein
LPASKAQQAEVAERRARAIQLRLAHVPLATIAAQLGYSSVAHVSQDLKRALEARRDEQREQADLLTALEAEKYDALEQRLWATIRRRHILVSQGRVMRDDDGQVLTDDDPAVRAAAVLLRVFERRAKLHGLDAPAQVTAKVEVQDELDADIKRLVAELAATPPAGLPAVLAEPPPGSEAAAAGRAGSRTDPPEDDPAQAVAVPGQAETASA